MRALSSDAAIRTALTLGAFVVAFVAVTLRLGHGAPDFYVFWAAARHSGAPYDPAVVTMAFKDIRLDDALAWPFVYPPTFLLFVWPFALAPAPVAYALWVGTSAALFMLAASHMVRPLWLLPALLLVWPVLSSAQLGQTSLMVGAALITAFLIIDRRPALAGILFAACACIKPQTMVLAPIVLWGRWRVLGWMVAGGAALVAASLVFGWERWLEWPKAVSAFSQIIARADRANPSALMGASWWPFAVCAFGVAFAVRQRNLLGLVGGAFCLTPYAHAYDLAPLAPEALVWLTRPREAGLGRTAAGAALLAGAVTTPAASLAFFGWLAAIDGRAALKRLVPGRAAHVEGPEGSPQRLS